VQHVLLLWTYILIKYKDFFEINVEHLCSYNIFFKYVKNLHLQNLIIASPDIGGAKKANIYANMLNTNVIFCYKKRTNDNKIKYINIIGDVFCKNVILIDDIVDTAETLITAAKLIKKLWVLELGMDAHGFGISFQEIDIIDITLPVTKWNIQITKAEKIYNNIYKAFYISKNGRPGPVLLDITKDAQIKYISCS
jgi:hypothetical protein